MLVAREKMLPSTSVEQPDSKKAKVWRVASWNAGSPEPNLTRLFKVLSLQKFLQTFNRQRRKDRYFDTGESGETYDAEMEAAASIEI